MLSHKVRLYLHSYTKHMVVYKSVWHSWQFLLKYIIVRLLLLVVEPSSRRRPAWLLIAHCSSISFSNRHAHDRSSRCGRNGFRGFQQFTRFRTPRVCLTIINRPVLRLNSIPEVRVDFHHRKQNFYLRDQISTHSSPSKTSYPSRKQWPPR